MPTVKRMRRHARERHGIEEGTTRWQLLMWGAPLVEDGPDFDSPAEERRAWNDHREELLKASEAGMRPHAYFVHDLGMSGPVVSKWQTQISVLLDHNLIDGAEALRVETSRAELSPRQSRANCQSFENEAAINQQHLGAYLLRDLAAGFEVASRWHAWRGRPELAERYKLRAETTRRVADGSR